MNLLVYLVRVTVMFTVTFLAVRIIGRKSVSEMTSYDLAALMVLSNVAAEPLVYKTSLKTATGVLVLAILANLVGLLSLSRRWYNADSSAVILVQNGTISRQALRGARMNIPLLLSELRNKGYPQLKDVAYAILEPMGELSVIPKAQNRPLQPQDVGIQPNPAALGLPLIVDGNVIHDNLPRVSYSYDKLLTQLQSMGITSPEQVLFAQLDDSGQLWVDLKVGSETVQEVL